jgi:hypothetical protein
MNGTTLTAKALLMRLKNPTAHSVFFQGSVPPSSPRVS